ncbi:hypothetical protein F2Q68_00038712 [Brassica cretica]|uniref:Uncharacterized protein n=1 Tax=Brassica cretica TaxID=69181 RepID=A0A8S9MRK1_BRACR|nr:hypothetical protein F2Q68_00038712 [Brassica cretica]
MVIIENLRQISAVVVVFDDDRLKKKLPLLQCHVWWSDILLLSLSHWIRHLAEEEKLKERDEEAKSRKL